jgi:Rap1a immunity proteins
MRLIAAALTVATALTVALGIHAAEEQPAMTAGDLEQLCTGSDHVSRNACRIYILGVTQGIAIGIRIAEGKSASRQPCVPGGISAEALEGAVKKKLATLGTGAGRDRDAAGFIAASLAAAYPCAKATQRNAQQ